MNISQRKEVFVVTRSTLTVLVSSSLLVAAPETKNGVSDKLKSYYLSLHTLQDAHLSETGGYAQSLGALGVGAKALPKSVDGYVPHFFAQKDAYRMSLAKPGADTLVFSSQGNLMRGEKVLYSVPSGALAQAVPGKTKGTKDVASKEKKPPAEAPITFQSDTLGPIAVDGKAFRLIKAFAVLGRKVNWPKVLSSYRILDERDSVLQEESFQVSLGEEGLEASYLHMGAAAVIGKKANGFLVHFNLDSTTLTGLASCQLYRLQKGSLTPITGRLSFRGSISGLRESDDSLKLSSKESITFAIWNGRFPTLATFQLDLAPVPGKEGKASKDGINLASPRIEQGYAVFDAGQNRQAFEPAVGETFSFYTNLETESFERQKVPPASKFKIGRVFVRLTLSDLRSPQTVLSKLDLESQAKTFVEVTINGKRGWVSIKDIRHFGFSEAG